MKWGGKKDTQFKHMLPIFSEVVNGKYCSVINHFHIYSAVYKVRGGSCFCGNYCGNKNSLCHSLMLIKTYSMKTPQVLQYIFSYLVHIQD